LGCTAAPKPSQFATWPCHGATWKDYTSAQPYAQVHRPVGASDPQRDLDQSAVGIGLKTSLPSGCETRGRTHAIRKPAPRVGDTGVVSLLARRLHEDSIRLYRRSSESEMRLRLQDERVSAARLIAEHEEIYPEQVASMRAEAEDALIDWMHSGPTPHANAMPALAKLGSTKGSDLLRAWANLKIALPGEGYRPPMPEDWVIATSAGRTWANARRALLACIAGRFEETAQTVDATMDSHHARRAIRLLAGRDGTEEVLLAVIPTNSCARDVSGGD
jgi:hypothetical protein